MSRHTRPVLAAFVSCGLLATSVGCGDGSAKPIARAAADPASQAPAQAPPSTVAAALVQVAESPASQRRLAYVNLDRLAEVDTILPREVILRRVLRSGAARIADVSGGAVETAVQVGPATVVRGPGVRSTSTDARPSGTDGVVFGARGPLARSLTATRPDPTAITAVATSAVQSCLGDATAQVIVGPEVLGPDAALGVGLQASRDRPAGVQLAVCYAPRFLRQIDATTEALTRRYGDLAVGPRAPIIREREIGERELMSAVLPADRLPKARVADLLGGGADLAALASRK